MRRTLGLAAALWVVLAASGCLHAVAPTRSRTPLPVTVGYAFDHEYDREQSTPPARLVTKVEEQLASRNLPPTTVAP